MPWRPCPGGRRRAPRSPPGSFAIGGGFAGIYPRASPGGWQLLGRTGFELFDPEVATLRDAAPRRHRPAARRGRRRRVRRCRRRGDGATRPAIGARRTPSRSSPRACSPMVQDLGRIGVASLGVPRAGAADLYAAADRQPAGGERGRARAWSRSPRSGHGCGSTPRPTWRWWVGPRPGVDGRPVALDTVVPISAGQELAVGATRKTSGATSRWRAGSRSPPSSGAVPRTCSPVSAPERSGPVTCSASGPPRGPGVGSCAATGPVPMAAPGVLRVLAGPDELAPTSPVSSPTTTWEVDGASDRMGVRLDGEEPVRPGTTTDRVAGHGHRRRAGAARRPARRPGCATTPRWAATRSPPRWCGPISACSASSGPATRCGSRWWTWAEADPGPDAGRAGPRPGRGGVVPGAQRLMPGDRSRNSGGRMDRRRGDAPRRWT